jgi:hypothetical protein
VDKKRAAIATSKLTIWFEVLSATYLVFLIPALITRQPKSKHAQEKRGDAGI